MSKNNQWKNPEKTKSVELLGKTECVAALVNTFDSDMIGFQLRVCHQTGCHVEQLESWFDAGHVTLFQKVFKAPFN